MTEQTRRVARYQHSGKDLGLPESSMTLIGPRVQLSGSRVLWSSFDRTAEGTRAQLHVYDLPAGTERVIDRAPAGAWLPFGTRDDVTAYGLDKQLVMTDGTAAATRFDRQERINEVVVTHDGVLWSEGRRNLYMFRFSDRMVNELPQSESDRWWFTATDHWVSWYEMEARELVLLDTRTATLHQLPHSIIQGAKVFGSHVTWTVPRADGKPGATMVAALP